MVSPAVPAAAAFARTDWAHRTLAIGWWLFIAAFFLAPDKHALRMTFYALVAVPALIWMRALLREVSWRDPLWLSVLATLLFLSLSALWGADATESHAFRAIKIMVVLIICFLVPRFLCRAGLLTIACLSAVILTLASIVALGTLIQNLIEISSGEQPLGIYVRLAGSGQYDNPLQYGGIVGCGAVLALCEWFRATRRWHQVILLIVIGLLGLSVVLTISRGPIIYFVIVSALVAAAYRERWRRTLLLLILAAASVLPVLLHPAGKSFLEANVSRSAYRLEIWATIVEETRGKELFGQGWRDDQSLHAPSGRFSHPHNFLLAIYRFSGLVGLALFVALTGLLLYRCASFERKIALPLGAWLLYGICLHLTNGRFPVAAPGNDWFFFWLPASLVFAFDRPAGQPHGNREQLL